MSNETKGTTPETQGVKSQSAAASSVVESAAMQSPSARKMAEHRAYVRSQEPPVGHARFCEIAEGRYAFQYNGCDILTLSLKKNVEAGLRYHSDGDFQSRPFLQQFVISAREPAEMEVRFTFPGEIVNMRPRRAQDGEAILGQMGFPLIHGVNGLYSLDWDLLISWHGQPFAWAVPRVEQTAQGYEAVLTVQLTQKPWVLLFRPRYYGEHLGYTYHQPWLRRPNGKAISGWSSWEAYHSDITQANVDNAATALRSLRDYGLATLQIDDGYQNELVPAAPGAPIAESWLTPNDKFPKGHAGIVGAIRAGGFEPGIWTNATCTNEAAVRAGNICLRHTNGEPIYGDWIQYIIDCTPEMLEREIVPYYRALQEAGYTYFKSDALRHLIYDGLEEAVRFGLLTNAEAETRMRAYMAAARKGMGEETYYLSCWGVLSQSIGVCDAMRVATDSNPKFYAYSMQLRETARWFFAQRVLFTVDPDHVCVRGEVHWARMMLSLSALTGCLYMVSDQPETYDPQRLDMIKKTLPGLTTRTAETGPIDYSTPACAFIRWEKDIEQGSYDVSHIEPDEPAPFTSLWATHFDQAGRSWCVVQRCAPVPLPSYGMPLEAAALPPGKTYYAFDFWARKGRLIQGGTVDFPALQLGDTTVMGLYDVSDGAPALVGSDRHVSMDAVSVEALARKEGGLEMRLTGFAGLSVNYWFYGPLEGKASAQGARVSCEKAGDLTRVQVDFEGASATVTVA